MKTANQILDANNKLRSDASSVRRLDDGYVSMRIPEKDDPKTGIIGYYTLIRLFPDLKHPDNSIRLRAWKILEASELGAVYRVTQRSPQQVQRAVKRGNQGIIVK
jgi:hypothetical protein